MPVNVTDLDTMLFHDVPTEFVDVMRAVVEPGDRLTARRRQEMGRRSARES